MNVVKATKTFRQVTLFSSLIFSIASIVICSIPEEDCPDNNLKAAVGLTAGLWIATFVLLLLQVIGYTKCLKNYPKTMFVFYFAVVIIMFFVQMITLGGNQGQKNPCMTETPMMYWYLIVQIGLFYFIVTYGLSTWGFYLCRAADAQQEIVDRHVEQYLEANKQKQASMQAAIMSSANKSMAAQPAPSANASVVQPIAIAAGPANPAQQPANPAYDNVDQLD